MIPSRPPSKRTGHRKTERQREGGAEEGGRVSKEAEESGGGDCNRTGWMESE